MTAPLLENDTVNHNVSQVRDNCESNTNNSSSTGGYRSRGWTPLKYPKSAILQDDEEAFLYFPLHRDVLLAATRELLILDGTLDAKTLAVSNTNMANFLVNGNKVVSIPVYKRHVDGPSCWPRSSEQQGNGSLFSSPSSLDSTGSKRKRCETHHGSSKQRQRRKPNPTYSKEVETTPPSSNDDNGSSNHQAVLVEDKHVQLPSAEAVALAIIKRVRVVDDSMTDDTDLANSQTKPNRPRLVSEADQTPYTSFASPKHSSTIAAVDMQKDGISVGSNECDQSQEISQVLDLTKRNSDGAYTWRAAPDANSKMLHASISNEALLRDAAMTMTEKLIETFSDGAIRTFFGYKSPSVSREQVARLLAGFFFDVSHAMFAWEQTEQEMLATAPASTNDDVIQKSLFDQRALKRIGGFGPCSILRHSISISRLRRKSKSLSSLSSWETFASTAQGQKMLAHHANSKTVISAGQRRRRHRLRRRYWLTSAFISHDVNSVESSPCKNPESRSRSSSFASSEDGCGDHDDGDNNTFVTSQSVMMDCRTKLVQEMPRSKAINLRKPVKGTSWGVCLVKEGEDCVVGRVSANFDPSDDQKKYLRCGDMILYARNERGEEASSRLCSWVTPGFVCQDFYRTMVDLFKTSEELDLVVQRV